MSRGHVFVTVQCHRAQACLLWIHQLRFPVGILLRFTLATKHETRVSVMSRTPISHQTLRHQAACQVKRNTLWEAPCRPSHIFWRTVWSVLEVIATPVIDTKAQGNNIAWHNRSLLAELDLSPHLHGSWTYDVLILTVKSPYAFGSWKQSLYLAWNIAK